MHICCSPRLIAACHVLRRRLVPRHSPCALSNLTLRNCTLCLHLRLWFSIFRHLIIQNTLMKNSFPQDLRFLCAFVLRMQDLISIFLLFVLLLVFLCSFQGAVSASIFPVRKKVVGLNGLEPSTSRLSGVRSNQLSYKPIKSLFFRIGS